MGQRQQIFIHSSNLQPVFGTRNKEEKKAFGVKETTVYAYHCQDLYGIRSIHICMRILKFLQDQKMNEQFFRHKSTKNKADSLARIMNLSVDPRHPYDLTDSSQVSLLNHMEPSIRHHYNGENNNDGVFIIDHQTLSYCYMNINKQETGPDSDGVYLLPTDAPVSAREYVTAYYPEPTGLDETRIDYILGELDRFQVMTFKEVKKIFPKSMTYAQSRAAYLKTKTES